MTDISDGLLWRVEMALTVIIPFVIAMFVTDLGIVFSIIGSIGATGVTFILPGMFWLKASEKTEYWYEPTRLGAWFLLIFGFLVGGFGLGTTMSEAIQGGKV